MTRAEAERLDRLETEIHQMTAGLERVTTALCGVQEAACILLEFTVDGTTSRPRPRSRRTGTASAAKVRHLHIVK